MKPKLFIGSSVEGINIAYAIQENLTYQTEATVWDQGIFEPAEHSLESIIKCVEDSDFGVFVFTPDDITKMRGGEYQTVRDNVLFELGIFIGHLGKQRTFIVMPREAKDFHIPTDLLGITPVKYETDRTDDNLKAATGAACNQIRQRVRKLGKRENDIDNSGSSKDTSETTEQKISIKEQSEQIISSVKGEDKVKKQDWFEAYQSDEYERAIKLLEEEIAISSNADEKLKLKSWIGFVKVEINYEEGIRHLKEIINEHPTFNFTYAVLAWVYSSEEYFEKALSTINEGIEKAEKKIFLKMEKLAFLNQEESLLLINDVMSEAPDYPQSYTKAASILRDQGRFDEAKAVYVKGVKELPKDEDILFNFGTFLLDRNESETALYIFDKLISLSPQNISYLGNLGNALLRLNFNGLALQAYEKANEIACEKQAWIIANIGNILNNRGFYPKAIEYLKKSLQLQEDYSYAHERLASTIKNAEEEQKKVNEILQKERLKLRSEALFGNKNDEEQNKE